MPVVRLLVDVGGKGGRERERKKRKEGGGKRRDAAGRRTSTISAAEGILFTKEEGRGEEKGVAGANFITVEFPILTHDQREKGKEGRQPSVAGPLSIATYETPSPFLSVKRKGEKKEKKRGKKKGVSPQSTASTSSSGYLIILTRLRRKRKEDNRSCLNKVGRAQHGTLFWQPMEKGKKKK